MTDAGANRETLTESAVDEIYRPILRGYFAVFAAYYIAMSPSHLWMLTGFDRIAMASAALIAAIVGVFGFTWLRHIRSPSKVLSLLLAMNLLVVLNVVIALNIEFRAEKLTYFIIMAMLFALASTSFIQSVISIALAALAFGTFMPRIDYAAFVSYAFLAFGAAMASLAIAFFLRKAITYIAAAKTRAEHELEYIADAKKIVDDELKDARLVGEQMRQRSLLDSLTGLPNRRAFFEALRKARGDAPKDKSIAHKPPHSVWLILVDLDGFKAVNDIHGHLIGDLLLKQVADRLSSFASEDLHISRMGGDEFNIVLSTSLEEQGVKGLCTEILDALDQPYVIEGRHVRVSGSIGCKRFEADEQSRSQIRQADYALMAAKKQGKNCCVVFDDHLAADADARYQVEAALRQADLEAELHLVFQPQFDLRTGTFERAEVLSRWSSPVVGHVSPDRFIKIAEESGLITDITLTVVEKALRELKSWQQPIPLSINLSSHDLISDPMIDQIIARSAHLNIDPSLVEFEVTETAMLADFEKATANLERMAQAGFSIALDDFGTGYSNFNYLRSLPITKLKVDRSFLENPADPMTEKILFSLAGMARTLGVRCLLEGVEDELDLLTAKRVGAESVQGFLFGKPMSAEELQTIVADRCSGYGVV
ncbi:MAG: EAL domain-containing protein [Pseudomonadota bacterium]